MIPFLSKYYNEQKISHRYWIAFATLITGIVDLFTIPFGYVCNYQADVTQKVIIWRIEKRKTYIEKIRGKTKDD